MLAFKLAYRNIKGAGLRTWLNVAVLSITYILIVWHQGFFTGMLQQGKRAMIEDYVAGGQYWQENYNPYDPLTYDESHGIIPINLKNQKIAPILIRQGAVYPKRRSQIVLLNGIDPDQTILKIPTSKLNLSEDNILPVLIGRRMARILNLNIDDYITVRWRDVNGTFDAIDGKVVHIMDTEVPTIDVGQLWIPLKELQKMTCMENEATIIIVGTDAKDQGDKSSPCVQGLDLPGWLFKDQTFLTKDITDLVKTKRTSSSIMYAVLLFLGMLAIFDTQVLAIFRRRKEIGTLIALGMTRIQVILLFTLEGAMHGILALCAAVIFGAPLIFLTAKYGIQFPRATEDFGIAIAQKLFPVYPLGIIVGTVIIVMITVTVVSFIPSRRISKLSPTDALKGKVS